MTKRIYLPIASDKVVSAFFSLACEYKKERLAINDIVVTHSTTTFNVRVKDSSMIDTNVHEGDILIIERFLEAVHGKIVIAVIDGEFIIKILYHKDDVIKLVPANPN